MMASRFLMPASELLVSDRELLSIASAISSKDFLYESIDWMLENWLLRSLNAAIRSCSD